jgi:hypothetical protein
VYVTFNGQELGRYTIQLVNLHGQLVLTKVVDITNNGQVVPFNTKDGLSKGAYMVKVLNNTKKAVFTDKILVE